MSSEKLAIWDKQHNLWSSISNSDTACYSLYLLKYENAISSLQRERIIIDHDRTSARYGRGFIEESQRPAVRPRSLTRRNNFYVVELSSYRATRRKS